MCAPKCKCPYVFFWRVRYTRLFFFPLVLPLSPILSLCRASLSSPLPAAWPSSAPQLIKEIKPAGSSGPLIHRSGPLIHRRRRVSHRRVSLPPSLAAHLCHHPILASIPKAQPAAAQSGDIDRSAQSSLHRPVFSTRAPVLRRLHREPPKSGLCLHEHEPCSSPPRRWQ